MNRGDKTGDEKDCSHLENVCSQNETERNRLMEHGTLSMYAHGKCRCNKCTIVHSAKSREYYNSHKPQARAYYLRNKDKIVGQVREYQLFTMRDRRAGYLRDKSCVDCFTKENLELHHVNPSNKSKRWSNVWLFSEKRRKVELSKCVVLCYRCHREHHFGLRQLNLGRFYEQNIWHSGYYG